MIVLFSLQKEMQGVDAPFYYLANEFHKLYEEKIEIFKSLGMQWNILNFETLCHTKPHSVLLYHALHYICIKLLIVVIDNEIQIKSGFAV